ncbi:MAG: hypothetical protein NZ561_05645, partial [Phycisphaerae bacterium]|nr:hypothetical protein [Phycisphaerae bacterium]
MRSFVRSLLLVLLSIVVLGGVFVLYALMQTPPPPAPAAGTVAAVKPGTSTPFERRAATPPADEAAKGKEAAGRAPDPGSEQNPRVIGAGENVWVKAFDKQNRLVNEFRAEHYDPRGNDVLVRRPQARFYLGDGEVLLIEAERGRIVVPSTSGQRETLRDPGNQTPTRGELQEVTLSLLESVNAPEPILRCTMNNVSFDNDTFSIMTEAFVDASGRTIPAGEVPIAIRGTDYDFDGYGLMIRWNEVDRRLQQLEMSRGDRLVVKNPAALRLDPAVAEGGDSPQLNRQADPIVVTWSGPLRINPGKTSRTLERQHYRAMLTDNVRIRQGQRELASGDVLEIAFAVEKTRTTASGQERPVVISLSGAPAIVQVQGFSARSGVVSYDTSTGSASLRSTAEFPHLGLQDAAGRTMLARQVDFDRTNGVAILHGPARIELPLPSGPEEQSNVNRVLVADAVKRCTVQLETAERPFAVKGATLEGDVAIDHPQMRLTCQKLALGFDASKAEPSIRNLEAEGGVRAVLLDEQGTAQKIECESLQLAARATGEGKIRADSFRAAGAVRLESSSQQVSAERLEVEFDDAEAVPGSPSFLKVGSERVRALLAERNVRFRAMDGASISAERVSFNRDAAAPP